MPDPDEIKVIRVTNIPRLLSPAGSDTQVQFNNAGSLGASDSLTWDNNNHVLTSASTIIQSEGTNALITTNGTAFLELGDPFAVNWSSAQGISIEPGSELDIYQTTGSAVLFSLGNGSLVEISGGPLKLDPFTVSTLPASPALGMFATVSDGTSGLSWGDTVTGGGVGDSTPYAVWYNGSNWTVMGK